MKQFECQHESSCSKPNTYWHRTDCAEMVDRFGKVIEREFLEFAPGPHDSFACTECGQSAYSRDIKKVKAAKPPTDGSGGRPQPEQGKQEELIRIPDPEGTTGVSGYKKDFEYW